MEIKAWIEEHPYLTGGAVLGIVILYFLLSSSSNSSPQVVQQSGGLSSADQASLAQTQIQTGAALQAQQNQATEQSNQLSAELAATQINANASTTANQLAAQTQLQNILTAGQVQNYSTDAGVTLGENTNATQLALAQVQTGGQVTLAGISAQENEYTAGTQASTLQAEYDAAVQSQGIISDAQTQQAQANSTTQQQIADYAAQVQLAGINGTTAVNLANIGANENVVNNQTSANLMAYQTGSNNQAAVDVASVDAYGNVINSGLNYLKSSNPNAEQVSLFNTLFGQPSTVTGGNFKASTGSGASTAAAQQLPSSFGITIPGIVGFTTTNP
jgi:hypothetical protein